MMIPSHQAHVAFKKIIFPVIKGYAHLIWAVSSLRDSNQVNMKANNSHWILVLVKDTCYVQFWGKLIMPLRSDHFALKKCYKFLSTRVAVTNFRQNDIKETPIMLNLF